MSTLQFKRILKYDGSMQEAIDNIITHVKPADGEPIVCSYKDGDVKKYFLAIGVGGSIKVIPSFDSFQDIIKFVKENSIDLIENTAEESDVTVSLNDSNKFVFKVKDSLKNN